MDWKKYESFVASVMAEEHIAGLAVAVMKNGEIIYSEGFGKADIETGAPVTPNTVFGVASVTKSFTALCIMRLAAEGKLSVEDPVVKHLPEFEVKGVANMADIKVKHLLSHTTGLAPMRRRQDLTTFSEHLDFIADEEVTLLGKPGEYVSYCNDAFLLLGAIIEKLTGERYRNYVTKDILHRLGMTRSTFCLDELHTWEDVSTPYIYSEKSGRLEKQQWPVLGNYEVGGGVRSTVLDLLKYGQFYIDYTNPYTRDMYAAGLPVARNSYYGYALRVTPRHAGVTIVEHGGAQPGVSANFGFIPEKRLVVALLANVTGVSAARLWLAAVNTALYAPLEYSTNTLYPRVFDDTVERYVGVYTTAEGGKVKVYAEGGTPHVEVEGMQFPLYYTGGQTFLYSYRGQKTLTFHMDEVGKAWAVFSGLRMLPRTE